MKKKLVFTGILAVVLVFMMFLAACVEDAPKTFTVSYDAGDGSGTPPASQTVEDGKSINLPGKGSLTAPAGKEFDGWKGDGSTYSTGDSYTVTKDVTFTAQWKSTTPAAPTGVKVRVGHFAINYQTEVITKIVIYEYDSSKSNNQGTVHQTTSGLALEYGKYWENGLITKTGKFVVEVVIGAGSYYATATVDIYSLSDPTVVLQYSGITLVKQ